MTDRHDDPQADLADTLGQLTDRSRELVRQEVQAARAEMVDKARAAAPGLALAGVAAAMGLAAAASAYHLMLRVLEKATSPVTGPFLATAVSASAATGAAIAARRALRAAPPPVPSETAASTGRAVAEAARAG